MSETQSLTIRRRGIFGRLLHQLRSFSVGPYSTRDPALSRLWSDGIFSDGRRGLSGVSVTEDTAFNYAAFWQGVGLISGHMASFPLQHYKRLQPSGKERLPNSKIHKMLDDEFNPYMSAFIGREMMQAHALTWGNAYAEIERNGMGIPIALWPLTPDRVTPFYTPTRDVAYKVINEDNTQIIIPAEDMVHIPGLGFDGLCGYGVVRRARESIGIGMASDRFAGSFFGNGSTFGGVLTSPDILDEESREGIRSSIEKFHQGIERSHRFLILHGGLTYQRLGVPPQDAQFLQNRKFQIEEIARWLNLPPHKLKHMEQMNHNTIEQQGIEYYTDTLFPWIVRWEKELNRKLIAPLERNIQFFEFMPEAVLRGDIASRYAAYAVGRQWGWLSADDVREKENMNPLPDKSGQIYLVPLNMSPANRLNEIIDKQVEPTPAPVAPDPTPQRMVDAVREQIGELRQRLDQTLDRIIVLRAGPEAPDPEMQQRIDALVAEREAISKDLIEKAALLAVAQEQVAAEQKRNEANDILIASVSERAGKWEAAAEASESLANLSDAARAEAAERAASAEIARADAEKRAKEAGDDSAVMESSWKDAERAAEEAETKYLQQFADAEEARAVRNDAEKRAILAEAELDRISIGAREELAKKDAILETRENEFSAMRQALADAQAARDAAEAAARKAIDAEAAAHNRALEEDTQRAAAEMDRDMAQRYADAMRAKQKAALAAHRKLYAHEMGRLVKREIANVRVYMVTHKKLETWVKNFYSQANDNRAVFADQLVPALTVHLAAIGSDASPLKMANDIVNQHFAQSFKELGDILAGDKDQFTESVERTIQLWDNERAERFADQLMEQEIP